MDREEAAKIGGINSQTLRDWVHRVNASGPEGLIDNRIEGPRLACQRDSWLSLRRRGGRPDREKMASSGGSAAISPSRYRPRESLPNLALEDLWAFVRRSI